MSTTIICGRLVKGPDDGVVAWPSAFWAIVAIALNSMLQPNGMVLSLPSTWGIALRSSPIVCLFDALDLTSFWLTLMFFGGESPRMAAKRVARVRFRDVDDEDGEQSLKSLRKKFWLIQVIFIVTTATQTVKLFACQGIIGTQLCAGFYIYSYLASEALIWAAGDDWKTAELPFLNSSSLDQIAAQGLLPWIPFHIFGALCHGAWIGTLFGDLFEVQMSTTVDVFFVGFTLVVSGSVVPLILNRTDSSRSIHLSSNQRKYFALLVLLELALEFAWAITTPLEGRYGPYLSASYPFGAILFVADQVSAAFNRSSRKVVDRITFTIPGVLIAVYQLLVATIWDKTIDEIALSIIIIGPLILVIPVLGSFGRRTFNMPPLLDFVWYIIVCAVLVFFVASDKLQVNGFLIIITVMGSKIFLSKLDRRFGGDNDRFSASLAGVCLVAMLAVTTFVWYWKVWILPFRHPECTVKPSWVEIFG